jgi:CHAT domain-containing protein
MDNLFAPSLIKEIRGASLIYVGLDGFLQRVPIGIIRTYLRSKGLESLRVIPVQSIADIGNHERKLLGGNSTVFYAPEFGDKPQCKSGISCQKQWDKLAYSSKEGEAVSELTSARKLSGKKASKFTFLAIKSPKVLHVSSHAGFSEDLDSGGLGSSSEQGAQQVLDGLYNLYIVTSGANLRPPKDTIITYNDLAGLDLSGTSLVVISACQTGLGGSIRGYGLFGMHRILSSVGADSTLLSMWKVDDEATSVLMSMFYTNLKEGYTVDQSLAKAQDRMIDDPKLISRGWAHPYYWAGWQVAGKMDPVFRK